MKPIPTPRAATLRSIQPDATNVLLEKHNGKQVTVTAISKDCGPDGCWYCEIITDFLPYPWNVSGKFLEGKPSRTKEQITLTMKTTDYKPISFKATKEEHRMFTKIAQRAVGMNREYDYQTALMDVNACHSNGNPLDLERLFAADDFNFAHDVFGIANHINRETGQLEDFFVPRFSKH